MKSVLLSILNYFMSMHAIPVAVAKRIEKLQRDFLWGGGGGGFSLSSSSVGSGLCS